MQISYARPLDLAWLRMKILLFAPVDLSRWFVIGLTAWLTQWGESGLGGLSSQWEFSDSFEGVGLNDQVTRSIHSTREFLSDGLTVLLVSLALVAVMVIWLLLLYVSSRGRFMFLDNLVHSRSEVRTPWHTFGPQADSLFLWQVVYSLVATVVITGTVLGGIFLFIPLTIAGPTPLAALPLAVLYGSLLFLVIITAVFFEFFLMAFVAPLMYRDRLSATEAWRIWWPLFQKHPAAFVLYGLLYCGIKITGGILFFLAGLLTCCAGWLLMVVPYIGTVVTLPLPVFCNYLNLEFLGQFGPEFRVLASPGSGQIQGDGAMIRTENLGQDGGAGQTGPEGS